MYQQYKNQVNFVWVYGSEAHPEEYPFREGYESTDLGWDHPYNITETMEERAQRARWMKSDPEPDFEIPMMIDYINHPGHQDNAIRTAYRGSGFYSGFVIDCDGTILDSHTWGWFGPNGEWWGLPLAPVEGLRLLLNNYLAHPSSCYRGDAVDGDAVVDGDVAVDGDGAVDGDAALDGDADPSDPDSDGDTPFTTPKLDDDHPGWKKQDCSLCHTLPVEYHVTIDQTECASCHGGNGACVPYAEEREHSASDSCVECHQSKHGYTESFGCISCHYADVGTRACEDGSDTEPDGDEQDSPSSPDGDAPNDDDGSNPDGDEGNASGSETEGSGCRQTGSPVFGVFLFLTLFAGFARRRTRVKLSTR